MLRNKMSDLKRKYYQAIGWRSGTGAGVLEEGKTVQGNILYLQQFKLTFLKLFSFVDRLLEICKYFPEMDIICSRKSKLTSHIFVDTEEAVGEHYDSVGYVDEASQETQTRKHRAAIDPTGALLLMQETREEGTKVRYKQQLQLEKEKVANEKEFNSERLEIERIKLQYTKKELDIRKYEIDLYVGIAKLKIESEERLKTLELKLKYSTQSHDD